MSRGIFAVVTSGRSIFIAALVVLIPMLAARATHAQTTIAVNSLSDPSSGGNCTLRDALDVATGGSPASGDKCASNAGGPYTITFTLTGTIKLSSQLPTIPPGDNVNILGPATTPGISINASGNEALTTDGNLEINNLTFTRGDAGLGNGGAIDNDGLLTVTNSTFSFNSASLGGAIFNQRALAVTNSTFAFNNAAQGGAIYNSGGIVFVTNSTFSLNNAEGGPYGGGIHNDSDGEINIKGTILADSHGGNCDNMTGTFNDDGYNISDDPTCGFSKTGSANNGDDVNPMLEPFVNNGGPTNTLAIPSNSPAVDAIPHASCTYPPISPNPCTTSGSRDQLTCDQRGEPRPDPKDGATGPCDIGAYEFQAPASVGGAPVIDCSTATASNPNLTALLPAFFLPEYIRGVNDPSGGYKLEITGVTQDKPVPGFPLCPDAFWSGTTTYLRTNNEPLQGKGPLLYQIWFTATDNQTGQSCTGDVSVCVNGLFQSQSCPAVDAAIDATKCP